VKEASPITASTDAVGTPAVQLPELFQAVLTVPFQLVCPHREAGRTDNKIRSVKQTRINFLSVFMRLNVI
jgi:hypothetical protein